MCLLHPAGPHTPGGVSSPRLDSAELSPCHLERLPVIKSPARWPLFLSFAFKWIAAKLCSGFQFALECRRRVSCVAAVLFPSLPKLVKSSTLLDHSRRREPEKTRISMQAGSTIIPRGLDMITLLPMSA